jgi:pimeloyl-ACP methyl ester carboxylesterase
VPSPPTPRARHSPSDSTSGRPPLETLTFERFSADADALREHLGFEEIAVLGHSFGGIIALEYALRHAERISRLILSGTTSAFDYREEIAANARRKGPPRSNFGCLGPRRPTKRRGAASCG